MNIVAGALWSILGLVTSSVLAMHSRVKKIRDVSRIFAGLCVISLIVLMLEGIGLLK